ncbi:MAG: S-methyl-5'-thioadenosine phosphorylase [Candidatus Micrarchaeota archaeon]|nr:S-methyl-5'-thioadenosine phosphorylase [Candidatus Micrarchaeota archaeon]
MEAEIGIIGGSGFYSLLEDAESIDVDTDYGKPSDSISVGTISGRRVAFIPRHSKRHNIPPHKVPYRANIQALHDLGVSRIIATNAVGSLNPKYKIGQIVALDQFVNFTSGREDTFFEKEVAHVSTADPYCPELRGIANSAAESLGLDYSGSGSVIVINGPRFSTRAESMLFRKQGFDLINMTQYPEVALARERSICYIAFGVVTDYDSGLIGVEGVEPVSHKEVIEAFSRNIGKVKDLVRETAGRVPGQRNCKCADALKDAVMPSN